MSKASEPRHAQINANEDSFNAQAYEENNVHSVYESIATHFSNTRYKPWPLVPSFLNSLPAGSIGADLGCGNGKYLSLRSVLIGDKVQQGVRSGNDILTIGLDRSSNLIDLASQNVVVGERIPSDIDIKCRNEVMVGDAISSCYRSRCFDFALSIATIHHFSTRERRIQSVQEIIRIIRPASKSTLSSAESAGNTFETRDHGTTGKFLIYVWALEQKGESRRKFEEVEMGNDEKGRDLLVPWVLNNKASMETHNGDQHEKVYQRFYHVFEQGELESLVEEAASEFKDTQVKLEKSGWEKGNWYGIWQCIEC